MDSKYGVLPITGTYRAPTAIGLDGVLIEKLDSAQNVAFHDGFPIATRTAEHRGQRFTRLASQRKDNGSSPKDPAGDLQISQICLVQFAKSQASFGMTSSVDREKH